MTWTVTYFQRWYVVFTKFSVFSSFHFHFLDLWIMWKCANKFTNIKFLHHCFLDVFSNYMCFLDLELNCIITSSLVSNSTEFYLRWFIVLFIHSFIYCNCALWAHFWQSFIFVSPWNVCHYIHSERIGICFASHLTITIIA